MFENRKSDENVGRYFRAENMTPLGPGEGGTARCETPNVFMNMSSQVK